jgi:glycosyltransferase involved in cell wall biosynthesis
MACEKVVVATDSGGVKEVIGDCGFLVPKNDSHALFLALKQAVLLPDSKAKAIGIKAHNRIICNYSINHAVERWLQLYLS